MDQELIAYFDAHFKEIARQISASREETAQQIAVIHEETTWRFEQVDKRFEQMDSRLGQVDDRFERLEDTARQNFVLVEGLRHQVHLVAEVIIGINERLERYHREATIAFDQVKGWIEPYYRELDSRVRTLEGRAERQQGDVMDAIRKLLGKPPLSPPATSE